MEKFFLIVDTVW